MFNNLFLSFSDSAKYADVARNIVSGFGHTSTFSFFGGPPVVLPFFTYSIAFFFKIFGVNDFAVVATSFFFFLLSLIFIFLLAKKIFDSRLIGYLSVIAVGFNQDLINYAVNGASESPFIFEIVAAIYFVSLKKKWANLISAILLILMYFTRPQAFIYIAGILLYYLLINFKTKKALVYFGIMGLMGILIDRFVLTPLTGKYFIYSILGKGTNVLSQVGAAQSASDQLRSGVLSYNFSVLSALKKVFYNLYNFYKLLPQIVNPYLFVLFVIGLFTSSSKTKKGGDEAFFSFKMTSLFMVLATLLVTAASIPFFRYIHPVVPVIYIIAVGALVEIITKYEFLNSKQLQIFKIKINQKIIVNLVTIFLILLFGVGQTLGVIFLDSRFEKKNKNLDKPPVYVVLSQILKANTNPDDVVVTNLDTWGSWYGERKTVWFPLDPKQLINPATGKIPFDAIYLTSYLKDDQNYYMGESWRMIFENPTDQSKWICEDCDIIARGFRLKEIYTISSNMDLERSDFKAVLLVRK